MSKRVTQKRPDDSVMNHFTTLGLGCGLDLEKPRPVNIRVKAVNLGPSSAIITGTDDVTREIPYDDPNYQEPQVGTIITLSVKRVVVGIKYKHPAKIEKLSDSEYLVRCRKCNAQKKIDTSGIDDGNAIIDKISGLHQGCDGLLEIYRGPDRTEEKRLEEIVNSQRLNPALT